MFGLEAIPDIEVKLLAAVAIAGIIGLTINTVAAKVIAYKNRKLDMQSASLSALEGDIGEIKMMVGTLSSGKPQIASQADLSDVEVRLRRKEKVQ
jgi:Co/Zn/Cd efflux system component